MLTGDVYRYMLLADYDTYIKCQEKVSATYAVSIIVSGFTLFPVFFIYVGSSKLNKEIWLLILNLDIIIMFITTIR